MVIAPLITCSKVNQADVVIQAAASLTRSVTAISEGVIAGVQLHKLQINPASPDIMLV